MAVSKETAVAGALTAASLALHAVVLTRAGGLWRDEIQTLTIATSGSFANLWNYMGRESFPLLFPLVLRSWNAAFTPSDFGLRLLGFCIGAAGLAALWRAMRDLQARPPLLSLALLGLAPSLLRWGDSVRGYGLGCALLALLCGSVWRVVEKPTGARTARAALAAVLAVQCLYQNAFFAAALCAGGALASRKPRVVAALFVAGLCAGVSLLPYLGPIRSASAWFQTRDFDLLWFLSRLRGAVAGPSPLAALIWAAVVGSTAALVFRKNTAREPAIFLGAATILGAAGFLWFLRRSGIPPQPWHLLPLLTFAAVLGDAAWGLGARKALPAVALAVALVAAPAALEAARTRRTDLDLQANRLARLAARGDMILLHPWFGGVAFQRYYRGSASWTTLPPLEDYSLERTDLLRLRISSPRPIAAVLDAMGTTLARGGTVWVVGPLTPPPPGRAPLELPPLPDAPGRWSEEPYTRAFGQQAGAFLLARSGTREAYPPPAGGPVNELEDFQLVAVREGRARAKPRR